MRASRWLQTESVEFIANIATIKLEMDYIHLFQEGWHDIITKLGSYSFRNFEWTDNTCFYYFKFHTFEIVSIM